MRFFSAYILNTIEHPKRLHKIKKFFIYFTEVIFLVYDYTYFFKEMSHFPSVFSLGHSHEHREIFCIKQGSGKRKIVLAAAFHGLEYLTGVALIDFAKKFLDMTEQHKNVTLFIVPLVNPDGVDIAIHGLNPKNIYHQEIISHTGIIDFKILWQANAQGVDINHNFNALWNSICDGPSPTKYGGPFPESEPETRAITHMLKIIRPDIFIAFHSQGKEIYYDFNGMESENSRQNALNIAKTCGYTVTEPTGTASFGGAKDWYIQEFQKEAYTIELGQGVNPLPHSQLSDMKKDVFRICSYLIRRNY